MNSSGSLIVLGFLASAAVAQTAPPLPDPVPPVLGGRVAAGVARMWDVEPEAVRLTWGRLPVSAVLTDDAPFRFLGRGEGGWFVVLFSPKGQPAAAARVRAGVADSVAVASRPLGIGARLASEDLSFRPEIHWGAPDVRPERRAALGWVVRRALAVGEALESPLVAPPTMVEAGRPIRVLWSGGAVTVAIDGVALNAAALGQPVRVRTVSRTGMLRGTVTGPGEARMDP